MAGFVAKEWIPTKFWIGAGFGLFGYDDEERRGYFQRSVTKRLEAMRFNHIVKKWY